MPGSRRWRLALCLALAPSFFFLCALPGWPQPVYGVISRTSEPDWSVLQNNFNEIEAGLQMTDEPLSSIESNLSERSNALTQREQESSATEQRLQQREQALNEREQALQLRESLYSDMQANLEAAQKKLKLSWIWLLLAAAAGGVAGYFIAK